MSPPRKVPKHRELKENPKETDHPQKTTPRYIKNDTFWELIRLSFAGTSGGGERSDFRPVWCIPQGISPARVGNPRGFWGIRGSARKADGSGIPGGRGVETSARAAPFGKQGPQTGCQNRSKSLKSKEFHGNPGSLATPCKKSLDSWDS